ncbi:MAG: hypothetical protein ACO3XP_09790 [Ilumatobacteraceae bacterium]
MSTTSSSRLKDLLARVTYIGGELAVQRGQFVRSHGTLSNVEKQTFELIDDTVTGLAVMIKKHLEQMDDAHYQEREQMEWRD